MDDVRHVSPRPAITIGLGYAAFDLSSDLTGSRIGAVEWLRNLADQVETQLMQFR